MESDAMITFWEIIKAVMIGVFLGAAMVWSNKRVMTNYKSKYEEWWTPRRYKVLFFTTAFITGSAWLLAYYFN